MLCSGSAVKCVVYVCNVWWPGTPRSVANTQIRIISSPRDRDLSPASHGTRSAHYPGPTHFIMRRKLFSIEGWFSLVMVSIKLRRGDMCPKYSRPGLRDYTQTLTWLGKHRWPSLVWILMHCGLRSWLIKICDVTNGDQSRARFGGHITAQEPGQH